MLFWCFLHRYHLYEFLSTFLKIIVKYTEHKIGHFNHFERDILTRWYVPWHCYTTVTTIHLQNFSSSQTEMPNLQCTRLYDVQRKASQEKDNFPSDTYGSYRLLRSSWPYPRRPIKAIVGITFLHPDTAVSFHIHWGCHILQPATPQSYLKNLKGNKQEARNKSSSS